VIDKTVCFTAQHYSARKTIFFKMQGCLLFSGWGVHGFLSSGLFFDRSLLLRSLKELRQRLFNLPFLRELYRNNDTELRFYANFHTPSSLRR